ncbi:MAG: primosomal protein N' [Pseudomonadota bacterium]
MPEFVAQVALMSPHFATLSYSVPLWLTSAGLTSAGVAPCAQVGQECLVQEGMRVVVPLGNGALRLGMVLNVVPRAGAVPDGVKLRPLLWSLDRVPLLDAAYLCMVKELAVRQACTAGQILGTALPQGLRTTQVRLRVFDSGQRNTIKPRELAKYDDATMHHLAALWRSGHVDVLSGSDDAAASERCSLAVDPPWPVRPSASRQLAILEHLYEHGTVDRRALTRALGPESAAALATLVKHGHVRLLSPHDDEYSSQSGGPAGEPAIEPDAVTLTAEQLLPPPEARVTLTAAQQAAVDDFVAAMADTKAQSRLLYGITGSGKTAVYLELARACLAHGRSVMLLAPEVALACKLRRDMAHAMPNVPCMLFHGYQSGPMREKLFRELGGRREPCVVVGTRSALFLPLHNIGVIVLDEEHDSSFKQDEGLNYQAKDLAWFRTGQERGVLILGSATPDLKTWFAVQQGHLQAATLSERVGGGTLPDVELVNIKNLSSTDGLLAPQSLAALRETVARGEQAVVLLNRRGYAPLMYCLDCGTVARCPHCDIGLTYHKGRERLVCHYCGYAIPHPTVCTKCKGHHYLPMGEGTERLEENMLTVLPAGGRVLRLDRDSTRRQGSMEEILAAFGREEAQILVGTQMLSKGHHFPKVTLAIVADGDMGLNLPDYRAAERTFQLLVQSSGRAGRGELRGKVLIQTRDTDHYCWQFIRNNDYEGFYAHEIAMRERRRYPPFVRLALVRMSFPMDAAQAQSKSYTQEKGFAALNAFAKVLKDLAREHGVSVLGPAPAPLPLLRGRKRFQCLLKAQSWPVIRAIFAKAVKDCSDVNLRVTLDIDPVNML